MFRRRMPLGARVSLGLVVAAVAVHEIVVIGAEGNALDAWPETIGDFRRVPDDWPLRDGNAAGAVLEDLVRALQGNLVTDRRRGKPDVEVFLNHANAWIRAGADPTAFPPGCAEWLRQHEDLLDAITSMLADPGAAHGPSGKGSDGPGRVWLQVRLSRILFIRSEWDAAAGRSDRAADGCAAILRLSRSSVAHADASCVNASALQASWALRVLRDVPCVLPEDVDGVATPRLFDLEEAWRAEACESWMLPRRTFSEIQALGVPLERFLLVRALQGVIRWDVARSLEARGATLRKLERARTDDAFVQEIEFPRLSDLTARTLGNAGCFSQCSSGGEWGASWANVAWDLPAERALTRRVAELRELRRVGRLPGRGRVRGGAARLPSETWSLDHDVDPDGKLHVRLVATRPWATEPIEWTER